MSGWGRLGIVISGCWLVLAATVYFLAMSADSALFDYVPNAFYTWVPGTASAKVTEIIKELYNDVPRQRTFNSLGFFGCLVIPLLGMWIVVLITRWICEGFRK